ncbi:MAG: TonB-dependent receptor [bacterium]
MKYLIALIILFAALNLRAYDISGIIIDKETKEALRGVTVKLKGTGFGTYSDAEGKFQIRKIPQGNYHLINSMIGYEMSEINIVLPQDTGKYFNIQLSSKSLKTNEIIVSANKRVQSVQEVPISVSTIDLKSLTQKNITDIDKALEYIPGIKMNGDHVSIRGSSGFAFGVGSKVAYLLDGFPLLSGDQGDLKFDIVPVFNIERIEVVKGAGSALYGTGALGGVINVITEEPKEQTSIKTKLYYGIYTKPKYEEWIYNNDFSFNRGIDLSLSKSFDDLGILASARILDDESYRQFDKRTNINTFLKANYKISDRDEFALTGSLAMNERDDWVYWKSMDSATVPPSGTNTDIRIKSDKMIIVGKYQHIFWNADFLTFRSGVYKTFFENTIDKEHDDYRSSTAYSYNSEIQSNNRLLKNIFLTSGLNFVYNTVDANVYGNNQQITSAFYSQMEYNIIDPLILTLGIRADYEKTSGSDENLEYSPKVGFLYKTPYEMNIRASLGKGFRTATIAEKFATINYGPFAVRPNANINPERSWSYELGMNKEFEFLNSFFLFDISLFQNDMTKMIEAGFVQDGGDLFIEFNNVSKARVRGIEFDFKTMLFNMIGLQSSVTWIDPKDLTPNSSDVLSVVTTDKLKYRSNILWYSGIMLPIGFIEFQLDYRFLSRADEVDELLEKFIEDAGERVNAHIIDARIILNLKDFLKEDVNIVLNANNLFDYYYTMYPGNLAPTRNIVFQIDAKF